MHIKETFFNFPNKILCACNLKLNYVKSQVGCDSKDKQDLIISKSKSAESAEKFWSFLCPSWKKKHFIWGEAIVRSVTWKSISSTKWGNKALRITALIKFLKISEAPEELPTINAFFGLIQDAVLRHIKRLKQSPIMHVSAITHAWVSDKINTRIFLFFCI